MTQPPQVSWSRTNRLIAEAAQRIGVIAEPLSAEHTDYFMVLRDGSRRVLVSKTRSPFLTQVAQTLSNNKHVSRQLLVSHGIACVPDVLVDSPDLSGAQALLATHGRVVVKPNWGNRGRGVRPEIRLPAALALACAEATDADLDEEAVVEPYIEGINIRAAVIGGRFAAAAEIRRPVLIGDGTRSAAELIAAVNEDGRRGCWSRPELTSTDRIEVDDELTQLLSHYGVAIDAPIPAQRHLELIGEELETIDRTAWLHEGWAALAERACTLLGVDVGGVDFRGPAEAFGKPPPPTWEVARAGLLEVNVLPALHLHALPTEGQSQPVFEAFVAYCVQRPGAPAPLSGVSGFDPLRPA